MGLPSLPLRASVGERRRVPGCAVGREVHFEPRAREARVGAEPVAEQRRQVVLRGCPHPRRRVTLVGDIARHLHDPKHPLRPVGKTDARRARRPGYPTDWFHSWGQVMPTSESSAGTWFCSKTDRGAHPQDRHWSVAESDPMRAVRRQRESAPAPCLAFRCTIFGEAT